MTSPADLLRRSRRIAVVGMSTNPGKPSHYVPEDLIDAGYDVVPVHPTADEILGRRAYRTLADVPGTIDLVNVFRPSDEAADVTREAIAAGAPAVWLQSGITSREARRIAEEAGADFVENLCIGVEVRRAGIRLAG